MKYLIALHHPTGYDGSKEPEEMHRNIDTLNDEMVAAGVRIFVGGLQPPDRATSLRAQADGSIAASQGHYLGTPEHVGGFWVLECANAEEALAWGRKAVAACRAPVEVRPFY